MTIEKVKPIWVNDADYTVRYCPIYHKWRDMRNRCYNEKYQIQQPSYKDCFVCEEWWTFSNFKKWMEQQNWQGKQLDKDIICSGNREYGPKTCIFVTHWLNTLICENKKQRGIRKNKRLEEEERKYREIIARHNATNRKT